MGSVSKEFLAWIIGSCIIIINIIIIIIIIIMIIIITLDMEILMVQPTWSPSPCVEEKYYMPKNEPQITVCFCTKKWYTYLWWKRTTKIYILIFIHFNIHFLKLCIALFEKILWAEATTSINQKHSAATLW